METRVCTKCRVEKPLAECFSVHYTRADGTIVRNRRCRECNILYQRARRVELKDEISAARKLDYSANKEKIKTRARESYQRHKKKRVSQKRRYREENLDKVRASMRRWFRENQPKRNTLQHRLMRNLRRRVWDVITLENKGIRKAGSTTRDLGCSVEELLSYLEKKFQPGMSWENYGKYWSVDHIVPLSSFDLSDREQFCRAAHYSNLQPLTISENSAKGNRKDLFHENPPS